mmetsp:Transcript_93049/g.221246  ORF Transcript_93049/g.221246 Transcript_93049/m.221246 type:complete len:200 (+) Transcript_93049:665-1264(+)
MSKLCRTEWDPTCLAGSCTSSQIKEVSPEGELSSVDEVPHSASSSSDSPDTDLKSSDCQLFSDSGFPASRCRRLSMVSGGACIGAGLAPSSSSESSPSRRSRKRLLSSEFSRCSSVLSSLESGMTCPKRAPRWWIFFSDSPFASDFERLERWLCIVEAVLRLHTDLMSVSGAAVLLPSFFWKTFASSSFHICSATEWRS